MRPPKNKHARQHLKNREQSKNRMNLNKSKCAGIFCFLIAAFGVSSAFLPTRQAFSASGEARPSAFKNQSFEPAVAALPEETPPPQIPPQIQAERVKIVVGETETISVFAEKINSFAVVSPEIAAAQIVNERFLTITGSAIGETILIVSDGRRRRTFIIEVTGKRAAERANVSDAERAAKEKPKTTGSLNAAYARGFDGNPSFLRNSAEFRRELSKDRTLRVAGETFKSIGGGEIDRRFAAAGGYGLNRISIGVDAPGRTIDFLDSQIKTSPLGFNNYTMRGFHLVKPAKPLSPLDHAPQGLEIFAGLARPSLSFYDADRGKLAGAIVPVANGETWRMRAGLMFVAPEKNSRFGRGGTILHLDGSFAPHKNLTANGEIAYAGGALSWRARLDWKSDKFGASGEIARFDENSPLGGVGAQTGGRRSEAAAFNWQPNKRFNAALQYNHAEITRRGGADGALADFNRSLFAASAGYRISGNSRLTLRFSDQRIESAVAGDAAKFQIGARSFVAGHNIRFAKNWSNNFDARLNFSREARSGAELENGFNLSEQLRFSWKSNSVAGFFNYNYNTFSLANLLVRNPRLLPPPLRDAFVADPARFFDVYRERAAFLLGGIELPQTRSLDAGIRFQTAFSRFALTGETRYAAGEIFSQKQNSLFASAGLSVRLDAANSVQINGWRSFGASGQSAVAFSFTHLFGAGGDGGFQLSKLLGLDKGRVQGRVYYDANGNGQDDAGEPGAAGMIVQLSENHSVKTDARGRYQLSARAGAYDIALVSEDLGVRLRASSATRQRIALGARQTLNVNFGVSDFGFVSGRVFNDLGANGRTPAPDSPALQGVRIVLRASGGADEQQQTTGAGGTYEFVNLRPGVYALEIDAATLPANFHLPGRAVREITVVPLRGVYCDVPLAAQRAVAGVVFADTDGDGKYDPQKDEPIAGAFVRAGARVAVSDRRGAYILRDLPAGKINLRARSPQASESSAIALELGAEPSIMREVNLAVRR